MRKIYKTLLSVLLSGLPFVADVRGHSMSPTLSDGDVLIYNPFACKFKRGDIVVVDAEGGSDETLVKRIIAFEREKIDIGTDGKIKIDGKLLDEPYITAPYKIKKRISKTIPPGCVWIMGDNRAQSTDSRSFGAIDIYKIIGRAVRRV